MSDPLLVTIPNVELLEVGEDWATSTGIFTFTEDDLASAIAMQDAPGVRTPVLKFGHTDGRFSGDGDFSVGRVCNQRASVDGQTLIGDYVGVPLWLARVLPSAYPRRSIEGMWATVNSTAHGLGTRSGFYLTAVALLGAYYPAISTLEDIENFWRGEEPPMYDTETGSIVPLSQALTSVAASGGAVGRKGMVAASASVDDVRTAYYDSLGPAQMYWWVRTMYVDPPELIVDDDEGGLWKVGYTVAETAGNTPPQITFADPVKVTVQYVNVAAGGNAGNPRPAVAAAVWSARAESRPGSVRAATTPPEGTKQMTREELCTSLGLAADATDADIIAAQLANPANPVNPASPANPANPVDPAEPRNPAEPGSPPPYGNPTPTGQTASTGDGGTTQGTVGGDTGAGVSAGAPKVGLPAGWAVIDEATLAKLTEGVQVGVQAATKLANEERDKFLTAAVKAGKFPPSRLQHYTQLWQTDAEGTRELVTHLAAGLVPVEMRGTNATDATSEGGAVQADNSYPDGWMPRGRQSARVAQEA